MCVCMFESEYLLTLTLTHLTVTCHKTYTWLEMRVCTYSYNSSPHYDGSRPEPNSLDINYNALRGDKYGDENAGNGGQACRPPTNG